MRPGLELTAHADLLPPTAASNGTDLQGLNTDVSACPDGVTEGITLREPGRRVSDDLMASLCANRPPDDGLPAILNNEQEQYLQRPFDCPSV